MDSATGKAPDGIDDVLQMTPDGTALFRWNGSQFAGAQTQSVYGYVFHGFRFGVNKAELGSTRGLRFWVYTQSGSKYDEAPDGYIALYELSTVPLQLTITNFGADSSVKVGGRFAVAMKVQRNDLNEPTSAGGVVCSARVGARAVKVVAAFPEDVAACLGVAPKWAKRKTIRLTISLTLDGVTVGRTAPVKVR